MLVPHNFLLLRYDIASYVCRIFLLNAIVIVIDMLYSTGTYDVLDGNR